MLLGHEVEQMRERSCRMTSSNLQFDEWWRRSLTDIDMMVTETPQGPYPFAGVPWFSTPFGRDGIITALELLWVNPSIAAGVLHYLAHTQAQTIDARQDSQPGKILHETRQGEMAALGEIPFGRYYGSVDATPLFLMLASAYYERTADRALIEAIWPQLELALAWIDKYGDADGDGFVEYCRQSPQGLVQQGWKDSQDSIFHADGTLASPPIALCEVQGYVYAARLGMARLAAMLGKHDQSSVLLAEAEQIKARFDQAFWCDDLATYAIALDGDKRPCRVRSSNAGHALMTGIAGEARVAHVTNTLMHERMFTGWGVRTIAADEARSNPMSYHNGSVWPHDNALIAYGLDRNRQKHACQRLLNGMFAASANLSICSGCPSCFADSKPEKVMAPRFIQSLARRNRGRPALYSCCCSRVWGYTFARPDCREVRFVYPALPESLSQIELRNLRIGDATVDLLLNRHGDDVGINVLRRAGDVEVVAVK